MRTWVAVLAAMVLAAAVSPVVAGDDAAAEKAAAEPVRVYTNADLEALGPLPAGSPAPVTGIEEPADWEQVQRFLAWEYERVDAAKRLELERAATEAHLKKLETGQRRPHWVAPYNGIYGVWWLSPFRYPRPPKGEIPLPPITHDPVDQPIWPLQDAASSPPPASAKEISRDIRQRIHTRGPVEKTGFRTKGRNRR